MAKEKPGAGQSKAARAARLAANKGVKAGAIRKGASGKYVRQWNAKTARWEIVGATKKTAASFLAQKKAAAPKASAKRDSGASEGPKRSMPVKARPNRPTGTPAAKRATPSNLTGFSVNKPGSVAARPSATIERISARPEKKKRTPPKKPSGPMTWK